MLSMRSVLVLASVAALVAGTLALLTFAYKQGQQRERTTTQLAALKQIERAQEQTDTWRTAYDKAIAQHAETGRQITLATDRNRRELERMRLGLASAPALPAGTPKAVGDAYTGAEQDIVGCAADVERLGREAAEAARSARALDAAWPTPAVAP